MIQPSDLHTHSQASDGQYTPRELVGLAKAAGIQCLALTDHDTIDGVEEAVAAGQDAGITVLRGVEFGASEDRHLHILGLNLASGCVTLEQLCQTLKDSRNQRKYRIVDFLEEKGIHIDLKEVEELAGGDVIARPHFAQILVRHGYVASTREAFDRYLDTNEYQRIERFKADASTCIDIIHKAGGKAVLAHPYQLKFSDEKLEDMVVQLKEQGLDGIECYYPKHTPAMVEQYLGFAKKYALHISGGSDFHGEKVKPDIALRPLPLELDWLLC